MRYSSLLLRPALCGLVLAVAPIAQAEKLVLASSNASSEYLKTRTVDGKRQPQSYVFMAGRYFAGNTHDNSLAKTSFRTIAERLAIDLRKQDFYPAASLTKADLFLVVHWGVTAGRNRDSVALAQSMENLANITHEATEAQRELDDAIAGGDLEKAVRARDTLSTLTNQSSSERQDIFTNQQSGGGEDSAALLGLSSALHKEDESLFDYERRKTLFEMTREECYFVVVMAYDAPTLVSTKKLKRVWTLRVSINTAGVNFHEALDRISNIASHYFGTKQETVTFDYPPARKRQERVNIGELIVIGPVEP